MRGSNSPGPINTTNNVNGISIIPPNISMQPRRLNGEQSDKNPITILSLCFYCCRQQQIILQNIFPLFLFTEASEMNKGKKIR